MLNLPCSFGTRVGPVLADLDRALDVFGEDLGSLTGMLRINASETAIRLLLDDAVPAFLARHPGMALALVADGHLVEHGFDAGIRFAAAVPQEMVAVPFDGPARFVPVASPGYLREHAAPRTPDDLHRGIRHRMPSVRSCCWGFERHGQEWAIEVPGALILYHNELMMIEFAAAGLGIAYVPEQTARALLSAGSWSSSTRGPRRWRVSVRTMPGTAMCRCACAPSSTF